MADRTQKRALPKRLTWQGECCIDAFQERKLELVEAWLSHTDVELDLSALAGIDSAGLQLLAAFVVELGQKAMWCIGVASRIS